MSVSLGLGHADLLSLMCVNWFQVGLHSTLPVGTSAGGGRSLIARGSIDDFLVRDN
jgi:hypothetical protein